MSEMSFRQYDPALGRFVATDALAHRSYSLTPYHFGFNNPVYFNDPTGLSPDIKGILMDLFDLSRAPITKWVNNSGFWTSNKQQWYDQYSRESGETLPELHIGKDNYGRGLQEYLSIRIKDHVYWNSGNYQWWRDGVAEQQWDELQTTLDYLGTVPVIGEPIDGMNAGISAVRGNYAAAALSLGAMIPVAGTGITIGKISTKAIDAGVTYTKSNMKLGRKMHEAYKLQDVIPTVAVKEYNKIPGVRPDFVDFSTNTIYELKPHNPRAMKAGNKQLEKYKKAFEEKFGGEWNTVLDTY